uniref:hypothetical protein n=1 Tax=Klebsiella pneumoniae TaxID=573 RepID=UPI0013D11CFF
QERCRQHQADETALAAAGGLIGNASMHQPLAACGHGVGQINVSGRYRIQRNALTLVCFADRFC